MTQLERATQLQKIMHDIEISYWESSITYDEMLDKQIELLLKYFKTSS
ncbi:hypothetical protein LCGC14_2103640 [marine sediment metagenome]|uniref:Uncharacterized protein n=1 Tax=marine sediment metagenome TaxID=412755 RepID=A0A0F9GMB7_9ZZZZ